MIPSLPSSVAATLRGFAVYPAASQLAVFSSAVAHLVDAVALLLYPSGSVDVTAWQSAPFSLGLMKRWAVIGVLVLLIGYVIVYRFLPWRRADRFRNAEVFVHTREFPHEWEARLFYPAAYVEWLLIRAHPQPWLPHPSWSEYPQVLLLEGYEWRATFPRDAFHKKT